MRKLHSSQLSFFDLQAQTCGNPELRVMDNILMENPQVLQIAARDFKTSKGYGCGREGISVEQVLRCGIIKQYERLPYRDLQWRIEDSILLRSFCRFSDQRVADFRRLQENIKYVSSQSWRDINKVLIEYARSKAIDSCKYVRIDTTVTESDIHRPSDSRLLEDVVRVLSRLQRAACTTFGHYVGKYPNRMRAVKKRVFRIGNTNQWEKKVELYRQLMELAEEVLGYTRDLLERLKKATADDIENMLLLDCFIEEFERYCGYGEQIMNQAHRRVMQGEKVPASDKIVSIFEPHTDIIKKGRRDTQYGHKICLTAGKSSLIFDCQILEGNPADTSEFIPALERTYSVTGVMPTHVSADDGFASLANGNEAKQRGVKQLAFGGKLKTELTRWVCSTRVQRKLRRFRAGIEGIISATKRAFGLDRCSWSGWEGFKRYVWSAVVAWNLQVIARALINRIEQTPRSGGVAYFDVRRSMFDVRCSDSF